MTQRVLRNAFAPAIHTQGRLCTGTCFSYSMHPGHRSKWGHSLSVSSPWGSHVVLWGTYFPCRTEGVHGTWWGDRALARSTGALDKAGQARWPGSGGDGPGCPHPQAPGPLGSASPGLSLSRVIGGWYQLPWRCPRPLFLVTLEAKTSHKNARVKSTTLQLTVHSNL